jgi:hypothetical protein
MCRHKLTRIERVMCVSAHAYTATHVYACVRACAWHLAWRVRVTLPVVHVHARMVACMRVCTCRART